MGEARREATRIAASAQGQDPTFGRCTPGDDSNTRNATELCETIANIGIAESQ